MALEMQIIYSMKSVMGAVLSLILVTGFVATAEENACVKFFRKGSSDFIETSDVIQQKQTQAFMGSVASGVVGVSCMFLRRTGLGIVGCGILGLTLGGSSYVYSATQAEKYQQLFDAHRLYQIYSSIPLGANNVDADNLEPSGYSQTFLSDLGVDKQKEKPALKEMSRLMEIGALCEGERTLSYQEVLDLMKKRIHNASYGYD